MSDIELQIFFPGKDESPLVDMLEMISRAIHARNPDLVAHGLFGGEFGYGAEWENDIFLMKPYCWCDRAGECPWCTGCAIYQDTGACLACSKPHLHSAECYQTELNGRFKAAGLSYILDGQFHEGNYDSDIKDAIYRDAAAKRGLDQTRGVAIHCDCGADAARAADIEKLGCDYHFGRGIFARFAPWTLDHKTGYYDPPNFWHKPSNFRTTWYKWIGRGMVLKNPPTDLSPILHDCLSSLEASPVVVPVDQL